MIVWLLVSLRSGGTKLAAFGMGCLIGGAAGNLIDRMFRGDAWLHGSVVDFIDFQWFPIFNVADIAVNVGAIGADPEQHSRQSLRRGGDRSAQTTTTSTRSTTPRQITTTDQVNSTGESHR